MQRSAAIGKEFDVFSRYGTARRDSIIRWAVESFLLVACSVYTEVCLHLLIFKTADDKIWFPILFAMCVGLFEAFIACFLPKIVRRIFIFVVIAGATVFAEVQLVYQAIFGNLMPLNLVQNGGGVFTNFGGQILYGMAQNWYRIAILALPLVAAVVFTILFRKSGKEKLSVRMKLSTLAALIAVLIITAAALLSGRSNAMSAYKTFTNPDTATDTSYKVIGMWATTAQEIRYMAFGGSSDLPKLLPGGDGDGNYSSLQYNVINGIDFKALAEQCGEGEEGLCDLDEYFATAVPTKKNDYTGIFKGYNVVSFCAESYSPYFISEELTPLLWEMTHHGFVFENYYGSFPSVTTNGEYTLCMGLFPDMTRTKTTSSFDVSIGHYLPFCLGNALRAEGYATYAYHNYLGDFYNRNITHPNMGYEFKSVGQGLDVELSWPASDDDMVKASVDDYAGSSPFHAYYMTFSGHYQYNWENAMSAKHHEEVKDLPYSEEVKAFIACNLEVEYALQTLMDRLEAEGVADKTLIVLTNDHYPYGLSEEQYNELAGKEVDPTFEYCRNSFICYVRGMDDVVVDTYCSTVDILPTVLNLLGVNYDSRLLAGVDVLSEGEHMAILANESYITKDFRYDAETGEVIPTDPASPPDRETVDRLCAIVSNKFGISTRMLNTNYYSHVFGEEGIQHEEVVVFEDIKSIFTQNNVTFLYRHGFVDAEDNKTFGGKEAAEFGELLDIIYRMAGKPEVTGMLPEWYYPGSENGSRWHDALLWAVAKGLIREGDPELVAPDETISSHLLLRVLYRAAAVFGVETKYDSDTVAAAAAEFPNVDREIIEAAVYISDNSVYVGYKGTLKGLLNPNNRENFFKRERLANVMFKFYTNLIDSSGT